MKLILCLTFAVSCSELSKAADSYDVGYQLALGPLEFFLKLGKREISVCYQDKDSDYENSLIGFTSDITKIRNKINSDLPYLPSRSKNTLNWSLDEMNKIAQSLKIFLVAIKENIFNKNLVEEYVIWNQRGVMEEHYSRYETHKNDEKIVHKKDHEKYIPSIEAAFQKILQKSKELVKNVLKCCASKNISYV